MLDLERNLDAYRILAEILSDLRRAIRTELEKQHGKDWFRKGLPEGVLDRLIDRKEKEKTIDWYESEYQEIINFATFSDALEVLEHNTTLVPFLRAIAPSAPLLHARLLELEVMRQKLALARSISENELVFLGTFHLRFHQAMENVAPPGKTSSRESTKPEAKDGDSAASAPEREDTGPRPNPEADAERPEQPSEKPEKPTELTGPRPVGKPKLRVGRGKTAEKRSPAVPPPAGPPAAVATGSAAPKLAEVPVTPPVKQALDDNDDRTVLRNLYREVTAIAEGIWGSDAPVAPSVWEKVRVHTWYEEKFSALGLKPLSDFYDIVEKVNKRMSNGIAKDELQTFLKDHNFAKVLLNLRDMFKKNNI